MTPTIPRTLNDASWVPLSSPSQTVARWAGRRACYSVPLRFIVASWCDGESGEWLQQTNSNPLIILPRRPGQLWYSGP